MIKTTLSDHEKQILSKVGSGGYGKELVAILAKVKAAYCSLDSVDRTKDYNAQVEGRLLFRDAIDEVIGALAHQERRPRPREGLDMS